MRRAGIIGVVSVILACAVALVGVVKYRDYRAAQVPASILAGAKNATVRISDCLLLRADHSITSITFNEVLEKIDKDLGVIDSTVIDSQTQLTEANSEKLLPLIQYMKAGQDALRAERNLFRRLMMRLSTSLELREAVREGQPLLQLIKIGTRGSKARADTEDARKSFEVATKHLQDALRTAASFAPADVLCDEHLLSRVLSNTKAQECTPSQQAQAAGAEALFSAGMMNESQLRESDCP